MLESSPHPMESLDYKIQQWDLEIKLHVVSSAAQTCNVLIDILELKKNGF